MTAAFPNETSQYRNARKELLDAEIALRRQIEQVASLRRKLPMGGEVPQDYVFASEDGDVRLSELFERGTTLLAYSYMFGPKMTQPCPMCTSFLDALEGNAPHIVQRTNLVVIARSPIERILQFTRARGWKNLRLLSSANNDYNRDYHGETADGSQIPIMNVFVKRGGGVRHFYATEMAFAGADPGQNERHIDMMWPLWNVLDLTPEGRGTDWYPKLNY